MTNEINDLKLAWKSAKKDSVHTIDAENIIAQAKASKRKSYQLKWGTVIILTMTLIGISAFFKYVANFQETLSHVGIVLMTGGLIVRILVELHSIWLYSKIDFVDSAKENTASFETFHKFRKKIHGTFTGVILVLYTIGFYLLTPEFSLYFDTTEMILLDLSYLPGAAIVLFFIRKGIRDEMLNLEKIMEIKRNLKDG